MTQDTQKWGKAAAKSRYGSTPTFSPPSEQQQKPQFPEDQHGPQYDNTASGWVRGAGESGEGRGKVL